MATITLITLNKEIPCYNVENSQETFIRDVTVVIRGAMLKVPIVGLILLVLYALAEMICVSNFWAHHT